MREAAAGIAAVVDRPDLILTSPLRRTARTADIVAKALDCRDRVETAGALPPGSSAAAVRQMLAASVGSRPRSSANA